MLEEPPKLPMFKETSRLNLWKTKQLAPKDRESRTNTGLLRVEAIAALFYAVTVTAAVMAAAPTEQSTSQLIQTIQSFESRNDPKCYATASRLEDFMFGTPLSFEARASKNLLQRDLVKDLWLSASVLAAAAHRGAVSNEDILSVSKQIFKLFKTIVGTLNSAFRIIR